MPRIPTAFPSIRKGERERSAGFEAMSAGRGIDREGGSICLCLERIEPCLLLAVAEDEEDLRPRPLAYFLNRWTAGFPFGKTKLLGIILCMADGRSDPGTFPDRPPGGSGQTFHPSPAPSAEPETQQDFTIDVSKHGNIHVTRLPSRYSKASTVCSENVLAQSAGRAYVPASVDLQRVTHAAVSVTIDEQAMGATAVALTVNEHLSRRADVALSAKSSSPGWRRFRGPSWNKSPLSNHAYIASLPLQQV